MPADHNRSADRGASRPAALARRLAELGPRAAAIKLGRRAHHAGRDLLWRARDRNRPTLPPAIPGERLVGRLAGLDVASLAASQDLRPLFEHALERRFNVLGSGWTAVRHGMTCPGLLGHVYPAAEPADSEGAWLAREVTPANLARSVGLWAMIDGAPPPIDWQRDIKSGYRWSARAWHADIPPSGPAGADIKVPWEIARLQHLPLLAIGHAHWPDADAPAAFRAQALDFAAANPPRFGVNWTCAMEVAIRLANFVLARDLFAVQGVAFDAAFEAELVAIVRAHGRFVFAHLEWQPDYRGNHYLADLVGLLFAAAYLPADGETRAWSRFATRELVAETARQFLADGASHEASTCYHALAAELVGFGTALMLGDGADVPAAHGDRLAGMLAFARDLAGPDGCLIQIGDNDSGRLFALPPKPKPMPPRAADLGAVLSGVLHGGGDGLGVLVAGLARGRRLAGAEPAAASPPRGTPPNPPVGARVRQFAAPGDGAPPSVAWYPAFGVAVFRAAWLFLAVRCRSQPLHGPGAHAHNDQLAIELWIHGHPLIRDPGSYLYTAAPAWRDRYRSIRAHDAPWLAGMGEPAMFAGPFGLRAGCLAECLHAGPEGFHGRLVGPAPAIHRLVRIAAASVEIVDWVEGNHAPRWVEPDPEATYSAGYGWREPSRSSMTVAQG